MFPFFIRRWFFSTNHKDIGSLYLIFGFLAGILGTFFFCFDKDRIGLPWQSNYRG